MTTIGGYILVICIFFVPPIVILRRWSKFTPKSVWLYGPPILATGYVLAWTLGPAIFLMAFNSFSHTLSEVPWPWPPFMAIIFSYLCYKFPDLALSSQPIRFLFLLPDTILFVITASGIISWLKHRENREKAERSKKIHDAIDKITADGIVEGPKGPYVPHKKWDTGLGSGTPSETKPPRHSGPYGTPNP